MKNYLSILITATLVISGRILSAQPKAANHINAGFQMKSVKAVSMDNYDAFKKSIQPLIKTMGAKQIIGLGEGTHGTADFYKVRFWISRTLVEEKGFNHIAFENDYSDCWLLNKQLNTNANLDSLMKKHMLSIWQNQETKELLQWVKGYNAVHDKKVTIDGIDYVFIRPDVEVLKQLLVGTPATNLIDTLPKIAKAAALQDDGWVATNDPASKFNFESIDKSSYEGYLAAEKLDKLITSADLDATAKARAHLAILNIEQAFGPFYSEFTKTPEASRDSDMAYNASLIMKAPGAKMIIWAHNAHLAKTGIYNNEVGGTGGKILKMFPNNYFVLGTGTANGTFAGTKEPRDTYTNPMIANTLEKPIAGSWEEVFSGMASPAFYMETGLFNPQKISKQIRFIGYGIDSGIKTYDKTNLSDLYDAFLFVKDTHAATPLK